jgi:geranylgeranyl reductase family protein
LKQSHDVIVIGAGLAGATLAYALARKGIGVLVLEKEKLPRYKCCAGGVTSKAAKLLDFDISEVAEDVIYEVSFSFSGGTPYLRQHSQPLMYTVMRDGFDHFLMKRAQQVGAVLRDGQKVTRVQVAADWVEITTADSVVRSRLVVGADGAYSVVARELGMEKRMEYVAGMESEIVASGEELVKWKSRVQMDLGCIPGGYAWVFPKRNHLSVGVECLASRARYLNRYREKFLNSLSMGNYTIARSSSHLIPTCTKGGLVWQDKALLLGDAAGLADPLTGEGIHNAILSAQLAAPVIENCLLGCKVGLQNYQEAIEEKIMSELRIARTLSRFFIRFPHLAFRMLNRSDGVWRAGSNLIFGEMNYAALKMKAGGFKDILNRLLGA